MDDPQIVLNGVTTLKLSPPNRLQFTMQDNSYLVFGTVKGIQRLIDAMLNDDNVSELFIFQRDKISTVLHQVKLKP